MNLNYVRKAFKILNEQGIWKLLLEGIIFMNFTKRKRMRSFFTKYSINGILVTLFNNKFFIINPNDLGLSYDLIFAEKEEKIREPLPTLFLLNYLKKVSKTQDYKVFIDVGANIGYYTVVLSDFFDKIVAIEPVKENVKYLRLNTRINNLDEKVKIIEGAIGEHSGNAYLLVSECRNASRIVNSITYNYKINPTKVYTLNEIVLREGINKNQILLLKMDVEGCEYNIIVGNRDFFVKYKPRLLFVEIHFDVLNEGQLNKIFKVLKESGYYIKKAFLENKYYGRGISMKLASNLHKLYVGETGEIITDYSVERFLKSSIYTSLLRSKHAVEFIFEIE